MQDQNDPTVFYPCYSIGGVLSGWQNGDPHQITIGAKLLADISNGWNEFNAGDYLNVFTVTPTDMATPILDTATPTRTSTPRVYDTAIPTDTPVPLFSPIPPCSPTSSIKFYYSSSTSGALTIVLSGPAVYTFTMYPGDIVTISVCPGTYTYDAYRGYSDLRGTVQDGQAVDINWP
jgi:hypothetical protein